ncbi:MAG: hypothetical protein KC561_16780 [Myxococcales bacterium]|nr:hypothetical protein [Myxococcales bacterium]
MGQSLASRTDRSLPRNERWANLAEWHSRLNAGDWEAAEQVQEIAEGVVGGEFVKRLREVEMPWHRSELEAVIDGIPISRRAKDVVLDLATCSLNGAKVMAAYEEWGSGEIPSSRGLVRLVLACRRPHLEDDVRRAAANSDRFDVVIDHATYGAWSREAGGWVERGEAAKHYDFLKCLGAAALAGRSATVGELAEAIWPGERMLETALDNRLQNLASTTRRRFGNLVVKAPDTGYGFSPSVRVLHLF